MRQIYKLIYDITNGLPPTVKNRNQKKKCRRCCIWMVIDSNQCFCCRQPLTTKRKKSSTRNEWHGNYPTYEALKMIPAHVESHINRING